MIVERAMRGTAEATVTRLDKLTRTNISGAEPSPGALRMRRARERKRQGAVTIDFLVDADAIQNMIEFGWLDPARRGNRAAGARAIVSLAARALALRTRSNG
jgi:hypothetical protein